MFSTISLYVAVIGAWVLSAVLLSALMTLACGRSDRLRDLAIAYCAHSALISFSVLTVSFLVLLGTVARGGAGTTTLIAISAVAAVAAAILICSVTHAIGLARAMLGGPH